MVLSNAHYHALIRGLRLATGFGKRGHVVEIRRGRLCAKSPGANEDLLLEVDFRLVLGDTRTRIDWTERTTKLLRPLSKSLRRKSLVATRTRLQVTDGVTRVLLTPNQKGTVAEYWPLLRKRDALGVADKPAIGCVRLDRRIRAFFRAAQKAGLYKHLTLFVMVDGQSLRLSFGAGDTQVVLDCPDAHVMSPVTLCVRSFRVEHVLRFPVDTVLTLYPWTRNEALVSELSGKPSKRPLVPARAWMIGPLTDSATDF